MNQIKEEVKKKRYWLRGGLIGGVLGVIFFIAIYLMFLIKKDASLYKFFSIGQSIMEWVPATHSNLGRNIFGWLVFLVGNSLADFIPIFIIGTIIGLIYGKIKNKKEVSNEIQ